MIAAQEKQETETLQPLGAVSCAQAKKLESFQALLPRIVSPLPYLEGILVFQHRI